MALKGKNELERFTDEIGYDKIYTVLNKWIINNKNVLDLEQIISLL